MLTNTYKNLLRRITENNEDGHRKALQNLKEQAHNIGGNLIYGIRHSTAIAQFNNGTFLYLTYIGTVAKVETDK